MGMYRIGGYVLPIALVADWLCVCIALVAMWSL